MLWQYGHAAAASVFFVAATICAWLRHPLTITQQSELLVQAMGAAVSASQLAWLPWQPPPAPLLLVLLLVLLLLLVAG
jgi:hypothetical protein